MTTTATTAAQNRVQTRLRSMTGFAQTVVQEDGFVLTVALRSVNHRSLDLHLNLPDHLYRLEPSVRKEIQALHPRGHLQLRVTLERDAASGPAINEALVGKYIELFRRTAEQYDLPLETAMITLSQLPGVIAATESRSSSQAWPQIDSAFVNALRETLQAWDAMRMEEALVLEKDLRARSLRICDLVEQAEQLRLAVLPIAQKRLRERLQEWIGQGILDGSRLAQEAAALAEHTDVSEEILRLKAHSAQFLALLDGDAEIGKKLDFLLQETLRELNTMLAKTTGLGEGGLSITEVGLEIKAEVEKLREQAQNLQ